MTITQDGMVSKRQSGRGWKQPPEHPPPTGPGGRGMNSMNSTHALTHARTHPVCLTLTSPAEIGISMCDIDVYLPVHTTYLHRPPITNLSQLPPPIHYLNIPHHKAQSTTYPSRSCTPPPLSIARIHPPAPHRTAYTAHNIPSHPKRVAPPSPPTGSSCAGPRNLLRLQTTAAAVHGRGCSAHARTHARPSLFLALP